jgi:hypothetical protein
MESEEKVPVPEVADVEAVEDVGAVKLPAAVLKKIKDIAPDFSKDVDAELNKMEAKNGKSNAKAGKTSEVNKVNETSESSETKAGKVNEAKEVSEATETKSDESIESADGNKESEKAEESEDKVDLDSQLRELLGLKDEESNLKDLPDDINALLKDPNKLQEIVKENQKLKLQQRIKEEAEMIDDALSSLDEDEASVLEDTIKKIVKSDLYDAFNSYDIKKRVASILALARGLAADQLNQLNQTKKEKIKKIQKEVLSEQDLKSSGESSKESAEEKKIKELRIRAMQGDPDAVIELQKYSPALQNIFKKLGI